jgi:hypothetical protein
MFTHSQKIAPLNMHHHLLKTEPSLGFELLILLRIPLVVSHVLNVLQRVPYGNTLFFELITYSLESTEFWPL